VIGIVGAAGAVGQTAAKALGRDGGHQLRLGGRRKPALDELAATLPGAQVAAVDLFGAAELAAFCDGCDVVLNCAGPAHEIGDRVARAALATGASYVDAAGDDVLLDQVERLLPGTAVVSAGMMPGLTGLLPRYLAGLTPGEPRTLTGYVGGRDRFTVTAAADYFQGGSTFGVPRMVLRDGRRTPEGTPQPEQLPFFPEKATSTAFLSTETERLCSQLGIPSASWYSVFAGEHVAAVMRGAADAEALSRAAALDAFGRRTYQLLVVELASTTGAKTVVLRGCGASELTGEFAALTAGMAAAGRIPAGAHHAGEILEPEPAIAWLRASPTVDDLTVLDGSAQETGSYVEETV
jgi:hypothetical protein